MGEIDADISMLIMAMRKCAKKFENQTFFPFFMS